MIVTVVIPCYNVANHVEAVIRDIPADIAWIIAVDDCSSDHTAEILDRLAQADSRIICLRHEKNQGVGGAVLTGFKKSLEVHSDIIIKMDGDHQMDSAYIPALIKPLVENKADYTKGNRFRDLKALRQMPVLRRIGNLGLSFFIKAASGYWNIFDPSNGFVAISNEMLQSIPLEQIHKRYFFESSMLIELYYSNAVIEEIPMKARYGDEQSQLSVTRTLFEFPPKLMKAFFKRIILKYFLFDFNIASLYLLFGVPFMVIGTVYGVTNFIAYSQHHVGAPTGTVVIPTLLIILGFQLLLSAISYDITNYPKK
jgi:glycosyltransferase involved in cell wall biosynthesis